MKPIRIFNSFDIASANKSPDYTAWAIYKDIDDAGCCGGSPCRDCILKHGSCISTIKHVCQTYADPNKLYVELTKDSHPELFI